VRGCAASEDGGEKLGEAEGGEIKEQLTGTGVEAPADVVGVEYDLAVSDSRWQ
jgi:hypothetical protein